MREFVVAGNSNSINSINSINSSSHSSSSLTSTTSIASDYKWTNVNLVSDVSTVRSAVHAGYVNMLRDTIQQLGFRAVPFLETSLSLVLSLLQMTYSNSLLLKADRGSRDVSETKRMRNTCYKIFTLVFETYKDLSLSRDIVLQPLKQILVKASVDMAAGLSRAERPSAMMEVIVSVSDTPDVRSYLLSKLEGGCDGGALVRATVGCLRSTGDTIVESALTFVERLMEHDEYVKSGGVEKSKLPPFGYVCNICKAGGSARHYVTDCPHKKDISKRKETVMLATGQTAEVSARTIVTEEIVVVKKKGTLLLRPHLHHLLCLFQERLTTRR